MTDRNEDSLLAGRQNQSYRYALSVALGVSACKIAIVDLEILQMQIVALGFWLELRYWTLC